MTIDTAPTSAPRLRQSHAGCRKGTPWQSHFISCDEPTCQHEIFRVLTGFSRTNDAIHMVDIARSIALTAHFYFGVASSLVLAERHRSFSQSSGSS